MQSLVMSVILGSSLMFWSAARSEIAAKKNAASSESGIEGEVALRPIRPHVTKGAPDAQPYQAKLLVLDSKNHEVGNFETDASGKFRITLPPGKYTLRPQSPGLYPRASEQTVVVSPNNLSRVRIIYDSGIR
jgi:hypothetical protein